MRAWWSDGDDHDVERRRGYYVKLPMAQVDIYQIVLTEAIYQNVKVGGQLLFVDGSREFGCSDDRAFDFDEHLDAAMGASGDNNIWSSAC